MTNADCVPIPASKAPRRHCAFRIDSGLRAARGQERRERPDERVARAGRVHRSYRVRRNVLVAAQRRDRERYRKCGAVDQQ